MPEITLNNKRFVLVGKLNSGTYNGYYISYNIIHIQVYNKEFVNDLMCYSSHSEVGMWRLGVTNKDEFVYEKSVDYVQSTLIHLELQNFINENYDSLPNVNIDEYISLGFFIVEPHPNPTSEVIGAIMVTSKFHSSIITTSRLTSFASRSIVPMVPPFDHITPRVVCGVTKDKDLLYSYLTNLNDALEKSYVIGSTNVVTPHYTNAFQTNIFIEGQIEVTRLLLVEDLKGYATPKFKKYIKDNNLPNGLYANELELTYLKCHITGIDGIDPLEIQYMPILLTKGGPGPDFNEITELGLNKRYILAGAYICKLFDYKGQCSEHEKGLIDCNGPYYYIGNRYKNVFPFNKLIENDLGEELSNTSLTDKREMLKEISEETISIPSNISVKEIDEKIIEEVKEKNAEEFLTTIPLPIEASNELERENNPLQIEPTVSEIPVKETTTARKSNRRITKKEPEELLSQPVTRRSAKKEPEELLSQPVTRRSAKKEPEAFEEETTTKRMKTRRSAKGGSRKSKKRRGRRTRRTRRTRRNRRTRK
jgi:hypothetical protein